ncbi:hypothetical protein Lsai_3085 [Legionella sainthelensi]|uniref:DUF4917 domain-containing protein n=1 Tax=Legionella sainthelensi TaxID=28087 RepID=A0A0W0YBM1_9GAMM|nr:DUF4917 family protein [Legionella sainthelensi]KTD54263.1 hypothetical protein Lsai_3085 [Legionella sainthelensi]VEH30023.1 Uncharacterised protein [Legionella sainthelensi]
MNTYEPTIIIGNGFNLALKECSHIHLQFGYKDILTKVKELSADYPNLKSFLEQANVDKDSKTEDLEVLLAILKNAPQCLCFCSTSYCDCKPNYQNEIIESLNLLKQLVITVMTNKDFHPSYRDIFIEENEPYLEACKQNLEFFERIFTINYDLILYWLLNNKELLGDFNKYGKHFKGKFRDGFSSKDEYKPIDEHKQLIKNLYGHAGTNNMPNLFFLHGALHLLQDKAKAYKIVRDEVKAIDLLELKELLQRDYSSFENLLVFDATSYDKVKNIYANAYLEKGYDKILTTSGNIVIYGCNVLDNCKKHIELGNDIHLWRRIINSRTKNIYIGIDATNKTHLDDLAKEAAKELKTLRCLEEQDIKIYCYSYRLCNIWKTDKFYNQITSNCSSGFSAAIHPH